VTDLKEIRCVDWTEPALIYKIVTFRGCLHYCFLGLSMHNGFEFLTLRRWTTCFWTMVPSSGPNIFFKL
jgi:hypothetical protein